jgi:integrase
MPDDKTTKPNEPANKPQRLTKRLIDQAQPGDKDRILRDTELGGFGCKITPAGTKVYFLFYRTQDGRQRRPVIGRHGAITCEEARSIAKKWLADVARGGDPSIERQDARRAPTVTKLCDRYLAEHVAVHNRPRTEKQARRIVETKIKPALGRLKVRTLTRADVMRLHGSMSETPREANHVLSILSKMMNLAEVWDLRTDGTNPCRHVKRYPELKRERFLASSEMETLGQTLADAEHETAESWQVVAGIRLLILTGCRLSEICELRWENVDPKTNLIRLQETKTGARTVYLTAPVAEVLSTLPRPDDCPWVLHAVKDLSRSLPTPTIEKGWKRIRHRAGLSDVRLHDLRHSHASVAAGAGLSLLLIGKLLGHQTPTTTARYAHLADDPVRLAAEAVSNTIGAMMRGKKAEVIKIGSG